MIILTSIVIDYSMTIGPDEEEITVYTPGAAKLLAKRNVVAAATNSNESSRGGGI